ncbi:hypothetical protein EKE94_17240 [Mesobaculum littorinae]|uniref:Lipoprotein n=1 Tax=Mesobaculum littorinae TaxID=2486419 RepID=A0A438AD46_9RHOB|nr:hypothetical protein [Mesobaculum littorinae]RVV96626.1 hypothetical protein EKE94_17240 [Mesobaculum littorinae]
MFRRLLPLPLLAAACAPAVNTPGAPQVRHVESTKTAGDGARWHLFIYDPAQPRPLDERIALAQAAVRDDPACRWVGAGRDTLAAETSSQGARYAETTLAAPLRCDT